MKVVGWARKACKRSKGQMGHSVSKRKSKKGKKAQVEISQEFEPSVLSTFYVSCRSFLSFFCFSLPISRFGSPASLF